MGFWKSWFSESDTASTTGATQIEEDAIARPGDLNNRNGRIFFTTDREIDLYELEELCDAVGWSRRPLRKVRKAIQHSFLVVSMWEMRANRRRLIGFSRATSDHAFNATIWDVAVRPSHQKRGLGRLLMVELLKDLDSYGIPLITLYADPGTDGFYKRFGFSTDPAGVRGMFRDTEL